MMSQTGERKGHSWKTMFASQAEFVYEGDCGGSISHASQGGIYKIGRIYPHDRTDRGRVEGIPNILNTGLSVRIE